jgi:tetratricopeptide (TPR) repeat protein
VARPLVGADILKKTFPLMPSGDAFQDQFRTSVQKSARFAALVIRIDGFDKILEQIGEDGASSVLVKVAETMTEMGAAHPVEWGRLGQDRFACFCPEVGESDGVEFGREIKQRLALLGEEGVSIGVAVYPFWPFEKEATLANAQKALDHAAFFGPGTVTPFDAVSLNIAADKLYQYGDIHGAIEAFKQALAVDAQNVNVLNSLGVCYAAQGELELAVDAFERAIQLDPKDVMARYNLGLAHLKQGDQKKALGLLLEASKLDGERPEVAYQIGICYRDRGQADLALEYLEKAVRNRPKGGHMYQALGDCYVDREMFHEAAKAYEKAIKRCPRDAKSLSALGHLYDVLGENLEIAITFCRESVAIEPENGRYRFRLGELYLEKGDYKEAIEALTMAAKLGEDSGELLSKAESAMEASVEN